METRKTKEKKSWAKPRGQKLALITHQCLGGRNVKLELTQMCPAMRQR